MKHYLSFLTIAALALIGCTPEDQPGTTQTGFEVNLEIPAEIVIEPDAKTIDFKVVDGKASATEIHVAPQNNGTEYIVTSGLEVGDTIIAEGAGLIKEGTTIRSRSANKVEGVE